MGSIYQILRKKYGDNVKIKFIDQKKTFIQKKLTSQNNFSLIDTNLLIEQIEEKALWSRYGL